MDELAGQHEVRRRRREPERVRVMGGLSAVRRFGTLGAVTAAALVAAGCEDKAAPPAPPKERSQAVQAASVVPTTPTAAALAPASAPAPARQVLCAHQLGQPAKEAPKSAV